MSYTVSIIQPPIPADEEEAWEFLQELDESSQEDDKSPSEKLLELHRRLTAVYPCIMDDPDGPWSDGPLIGNFKRDITTLGISYSRVREVLPFVINTAVEMGFVVFDGQNERIHRPANAPVLPRAKDEPPPKGKWWKFW